MNGLYRHLSMLEAKAEPFVLVTVTEVQGSTPREGGAKMVVTREASFATIGGGQLEFTAIETARQLLDGNAVQPVTRKYPLGPTLGQCCGGQVSLLYEVQRPATLRLGLFGAGHVARALVGKLGDVPCRIDWYDPRAEEFPASVPDHVAKHVTEKLEAGIAALAPGAFVLIMTHDHPLDLALTAAALKRPDLPFIGLIGSATKRARFQSRLRGMGFSDEDLSRIVCPIGLPGITGKQPGVIALAVAAQLLQAAEGTPGLRHWDKEDVSWALPPNA
ncbi:xanthine dehydrogenase accessory protein XdhC [Lacibacterium aquatile]|uniref:Xanthine dehydrogenase accessory protein XdhC n=1 Tax=Lacibacterium aquatile TaxID=1168082 RepID=A0ABW5DYN5_9PROT